MPSLVLTHPHTHAGTSYRPGDRIAVSAMTADWLIAQGIAQPEAGPAKPELEPKPLPRKEPKP